MWTERVDGRRTPGCARPGWLRRAGFRAQETPGPAWGREREAAFGRRGWGFAGGAEFVSRITGSASRARSPPRQAALVARGSPARAGEGRAGRPAPRDIRFPVTLSEPNFLNSLGELAGMNAFPICRSAQNTRRTFFVVPPPHRPASGFSCDFRRGTCIIRVGPSTQGSAGRSTPRFHRGSHIAANLEERMTF